MQFTIDTAHLPIGFEGGKITILQFASLFLIPSLIIRYKMVLQRLSRVNNHDAIVLFLVALFYFCVLLSTLLSPFPEVAIAGNPFRFLGLANISLLFLSFVYFYFLSEAEDLNLILHMFLAFSLVHSFIGIADLKGLSSTQLQSGYFVNGNFGQANFFAGTMLAAYALSLLRLSFIKCKWFWRVGYFLLAAIFATVLALTFSKGAIAIGVVYAIGILAAKVLLQLDVRQKLTKKRLPRGAISATIFILFSLVMAITALKLDASRAIIWPDMVKLTMHRPLTGYGPDSMILAMKAENQLPDRFIDRAHDFPLDITTHFGIPALIICLGLILYTIRKATRPNISINLLCVLVLPLTFWLTGIIHTKSIYHYSELAVFSAISLSLLAPEFNKKSRN